MSGSRSASPLVSLGTSKTNYIDPRVSVAWCKRCEVNISGVFARTLRDKFNWAMAAGPDWRFEAMAVKVSAKKKGPGAADSDDSD